MSMTPNLAGQHITQERVLRPDTEHVLVDDAETSGGTETIFGTITIPSLGFFLVDTLQIPSVWVNATTLDSSPGDRFRMQIRDDDTAGTIRGADIQEFGDSQQRLTFAIPMAQARSVPMFLQATYVATMTRVVGSGSLNITGGGDANPSGMSVLVLPDPGGAGP